MGILTKNQPVEIFADAAAIAEPPQSPTLADPARSPRGAALSALDALDGRSNERHADDRPTASDPLAAAYATLPPPAPCPVCGSPILWLDVYRRGWQCPESATCSPPPIAALVLARVLLVDEGTPAKPQPQWARVQIAEHRSKGETKWRRHVYTTPIRCEANGNAPTLADLGGGGDGGDDVAGEAGGSGDAATTVQTATSQPRIFIDDTLGRNFWYAEMNGALGNQARSTGRVFYRDVDDWWGTKIGDWKNYCRLFTTVT